MLGIILLVGSLLTIGSMLARYGTSSVARARDGETKPSPARNQALLEVSDSVARTVKYMVVPAGLLLLGGVLIRGGRRPDRTHELRAETEAED
jgi:hypothetical protein